MRLGFSIYWVFFPLISRWKLVDDKDESIWTGHLSSEDEACKVLKRETE